MEQLLEYGEARRGRRRITSQDLTPVLAEALEIGVDRGALVTGVDPGSAGAGIRSRDVVALNGAPIESSTELRNRIGLTRVGETVKLGVWCDRRLLEIDIRVAAAEPQQSITRARVRPATSSTASSSATPVAATRATDRSRACSSVGQAPEPGLARGPPGRRARRRRQPPSRRERGRAHRGAARRTRAIRHRGRAQRRAHIRPRAVTAPARRAPRTSAP